MLLKEHKDNKIKRTKFVTYIEKIHSDEPD